MGYIKKRTFLRAFKAKGKYKSVHLAYSIPLKSRGFRFSMKKQLKDQYQLIKWPEFLALEVEILMKKTLGNTAENYCANHY